MNKTSDTETMYMSTGVKLTFNLQNYQGGNNSSLTELHWEAEQHKQDVTFLHK